MYVGSDGEVTIPPCIQHILSKIKLRPKLPGKFQWDLWRPWKLLHCPTLSHKWILNTVNAFITQLQWQHLKVKVWSSCSLSWVLFQKETHYTTFHFNTLILQLSFHNFHTTWLNWQLNSLHNSDSSSFPRRYSNLATQPSLQITAFFFPCSVNTVIFSRCLNFLITYVTRLQGLESKSHFRFLELQSHSDDWYLKIKKNYKTLTCLVEFKSLKFYILTSQLSRSVPSRYIAKVSYVPHTEVYQTSEDHKSRNTW